MKTFTQLKEQAEQELDSVGAKLSKLMKKRAVFILEYLANKYNVTKLIMGNGHFSLSGGKGLMMDRDCPNYVYTHDNMGNNLFAALNPKQRSVPMMWDITDELLVSELQDILYYLTDVPHFQTFDWTSVKK